MHVFVIRIWHEGKKIPRWQYGRLVPVEGELSLRECRDDYLNRNLRSAHLDIVRNSPSRHLHDRETNILPKLVDAAILWLRGRQLVISGFELDEEKDRMYAQTWVVELAKEIPKPSDQPTQAPELGAGPRP